jgi:hypothetical protein
MKASVENRMLCSDLNAGFKAELTNASTKLSNLVKTCGGLNLAYPFAMSTRAEIMAEASGPRRVYDGLYSRASAIEAEMRGSPDEVLAKLEGLSEMWTALELADSREPKPMYAAKGHQIHHSLRSELSRIRDGREWLNRQLIESDRTAQSTGMRESNATPGPNGSDVTSGWIGALATPKTASMFRPNEDAAERVQMTECRRAVARLVNMITMPKSNAIQRACTDITAEMDDERMSEHWPHRMCSSIQALELTTKEKKSRVTSKLSTVLRRC